MNSKQRNQVKKEIESLKVDNWQLTSGQVMWCIFGIVTLITIFGPWFCYGYVKKYQVKKEANRARIQELEGRIQATSP